MTIDGNSCFRYICYHKYFVMDILEKIKRLPLDKQKEVEAMVDSLLNKQESEPLDMVAIAEKRRKNIGRLEGKIWMADDFNETPEEFKNYL